MLKSNTVLAAAKGANSLAVLLCPFSPYHTHSERPHLHRKE